MSTSITLKTIQSFKNKIDKEDKIKIGAPRRRTYETAPN